MTILLAVGTAASAVRPDTLESGFATPPRDARPETWFHLIGGNVSKPGLTTDLEAVAGAGLQGIQLFHGKGRAWPGVTPQITCLSSDWDDMIGHVADETERLGLGFTMQNCPGWAMSGGPWITPDKAMRHLVWTRTNLAGGTSLSADLEQPFARGEDWRDYRDIAVLAFPTPLDDHGAYLVPDEVTSNRDRLPWSTLLRGDTATTLRIEPEAGPTWVEVSFAEPTPLRSLELPPVEHLMMRRNFDPDSVVRIQAAHDGGWVELVHHRIPRGTWQDRLPEFPLVLAVPDADARTYRICFENKHPMELAYLRLSSAARIHDGRAQAGYALRSLEHRTPPSQDPRAWVSVDAIVDVSAHMDERGRLTWDAPPGNWTVVRFGHVNTGVKNKPAPPEATGFECDKLSPAGAEQHFAGYIGRLSAPGGPADRGRLQGMLIDSWECYTQTWTPAMEQEFGTRRGYSLRPWLPALAGWVVDDHQTSERFLRDWRATISDLLVHNYFGRLAELGRERGLKLSFETALGDVSPGDILQYFSKADVPMCEFWRPNDPHWGGYETKPIHPTVSAAHIYGKPRVAAEAFTNIGIHWKEHPFMLKHLADRHFALGVTHLVFHTYTHNPLDAVPGTSFGGRIGTPFLRGQTWWSHMEPFTAYLARCQFLLEQGRPVADVLWYLGDEVDHKPRQDTPFPEGYDFDYLNADVLLHRLRVVDGDLRTPEGVTWKVLWLPAESCRRLTPATLARLQDLLQDGATIIGSPPARSPSLSGGVQADRDFAARVRALWGDAPGVGGDRRLGRGRLLWGDDLQTSLAVLGIVPDVVGARAATWCHRRVEGTELYFVAADRVSPLNANLRFRAGGIPERWDPLTGKTAPVAIFHQAGDHTVVPLDLPAAGSVFIVFRPGRSAPAVTTITRDGAAWIDATDPTRVDQGEPFPGFGLTRRDELQPWVEPASPIGALLGGGRQFLSWVDGTFGFARDGQPLGSVNVEGTRPILLENHWRLSFPSGWGTPEEVTLPDLKPWSALEAPATRAFSGTATYHTTLTLDAPGPDTRLLLDLGRVANIAEVFVNGKHVATLWAPPFRTDITPHVEGGATRIEVRITNTWHNRLAYDASHPPAERKTWTYERPQADAPLEPAGLIGPVRIRVGKVVDLGPG